MQRRVIGLLALVMTVGTASGASACLRKPPPQPKIAKQVDHTQRDVLAAEKALAKGDNAKAGQLARGAIPTIAQLPPTDAAELATRAQRTLAIAAVRSGGEVHAFELDGADAAHVKAANVAWAGLVLGYQAALKSDNVMVKLQLAEALAADDYQRNRARDMLRDLAARDLMPSARGYAMLAQLEGDAALRDAALGRCRDLGGDSTCKA